ncbi:MAG: ATP synthase F1 subunit delta [Pyrinomonadaceae bacterium]
MSAETIARRYAVALADVVGKDGNVESVKSEISTWVSLLGSTPDLKSAFGNPSITQTSKGKLLEALIERSKPSVTTANFLRVLLQNGRLSELSEISDRFASVIDERNSVISAEITSARDLSDQQRSELKHNLEKVTGKTVILNFSISEALIGGVVTRIGSTIYDGSVRTQLENLKQELING